MAYSNYPNQFSSFSGHFAYASDSQYSVNQIATDMYEMNNRRQMAYSNQIYGVPSNLSLPPPPPPLPLPPTMVTSSTAAIPFQYVYAAPTPIYPPIRSTPFPRVLPAPLPQPSTSVSSSLAPVRPTNSSRTSSSRRSSNRPPTSGKTSRLSNSSNIVRVPLHTQEQLASPRANSRYSTKQRADSERSRSTVGPAVYANTDSKDVTATTLQDFDEEGVSGSLLVNNDETVTGDGDLTFNRANSENINQHSELVSTHNLPPSTSSVRTTSNIDYVNITDEDNNSNQFTYRSQSEAQQQQQNNYTISGSSRRSSNLRNIVSIQEQENTADEQSLLNESQTTAVPGTSAASELQNYADEPSSSRRVSRATVQEIIDLSHKLVASRHASLHDQNDLSQPTESRHSSVHDQGQRLPSRHSSLHARVILVS
jgi:hypothetical protein